MTTNAFRESLKQAGITQREAARILHVNERTIRRWCANPDSKSYREPPYATVEYLKYKLQSINGRKHE